MIPVVIPAIMKAAEEAAIEAGYPADAMMERAATEIARWITGNISPMEDPSHALLFAEPTNAVALVGPGNNGGDALMTLALLADYGWAASAIYLGRDGLGDLALPPGADELIDEYTDPGVLNDADVILDGVLGYQGRPAIPEDWLETFDLAREVALTKGVPIVAIDVPSGIDAATGEADPGALEASFTLAIQFPKIGSILESAASKLGELVVLDIGIETPADFSGPHFFMANDAKRVVPKRPAWSHKTAVGGVLVIGGAPGYYGAPRLSGEAALRAGAGYVGLAVPRSIIGPIASAVPELIYHPVSDGDGRRSAALVREALAESGDRYRCLLIGPGLGRDEVANDILGNLLGGSGTSVSNEEAIAFGIPRHVRVADDQGGESIITSRKAVIDADGLNWLARQPNWPSLLPECSCVLTPHAGEMARLLGHEDTSKVTADPFGVASRAASEWNQVVVLKAGWTCVADPDGRVVLAQRATPELATAGTGDVLSGLVAAFIAQGVAPFDAACLGVSIGAETGRILRAQFGTHSVIARDLIGAVPIVMRELTPWP